jgi:hypothetical protein
LPDLFRDAWLSKVLFTAVAEAEAEMRRLIRAASNKDTISQWADKETDGSGI